MQRIYSLCRLDTILIRKEGVVVQSYTVNVSANRVQLVDEGLISPDEADLHVKGAREAGV